MVALAGAAKAQEMIPRFKAPAVFVDIGGSYPFGIDAADAIGVQGGQPDGYPDVVVAIGQIDIHDAPLIFDYTELHGLLAVYANTQSWGTPSNGLQLREYIDLGDEACPGEVLWADVDGDLLQDIVVAIGSPYPDEAWDGSQPWGIKVYRNTGGGFEFRDEILTPFPLRGLTVADFDNDGDLDAAACVDFLATFADPVQKDYICIATNDGTGDLSLTPQSPYGVDSGGGASNEGVGDVVAGHFDLLPGIKTLPDLFTSGFHDQGVSMVATATNTGSAAFSFTPITGCTPQPFLTDVRPGAFVTGQFFDDAVAIGADTGLLYLYHGDGNGGFTINCGAEPNDIYLENLLAGFLPRGVAVGHLNGGTKPDVVVVDGLSRAICLPGKGDGTLQFSASDPRYLNSVGADRPMRVVIADMDLDGHPDLVTSNHGGTGDPASISVLINKMISTLP